jgi:hypothetical protein
VLTVFAIRNKRAKPSYFFQPEIPSVDDFFYHAFFSFQPQLASLLVCEISTTASHANLTGVDLFGVVLVSDAWHTEPSVHTWTTNWPGRNRPTGQCDDL